MPTFWVGPVVRATKPMGSRENVAGILGSVRRSDRQHHAHDGPNASSVTSPECALRVRYGQDGPRHRSDQGEGPVGAGWPLSWTGLTPRNGTSMRWSRLGLVVYSTCHSRISLLLMIATQAARRGPSVAPHIACHNSFDRCSRPLLTRPGSL